jgi:hypothetical protein
MQNLGYIVPRECEGVFSFVGWGPRPSRLTGLQVAAIIAARL